MTGIWRWMVHENHRPMKMTGLWRSLANEGHERIKIIDLQRSPVSILDEKVCLHFALMLFGKSGKHSFLPFITHPQIKVGCAALFETSFREGQLNFEFKHGKTSKRKILSQSRSAALKVTRGYLQPVLKLGWWQSMSPTLEKYHSPSRVDFQNGLCKPDNFFEVCALEKKKDIDGYRNYNWGRENCKKNNNSRCLLLYTSVYIRRCL